MLIKEYRIALPMSLQEYQVAQLYMIQKKSREESSGEGSGVEILENCPYADGPGGCGQFTHKVYHVGSHIPGWFRALLPKAALQVEEESWNAYPYTRTRYTCPFVEKFSIDIETYYKPDCGDQSNVFNLMSAEKRQRIVDVIDIVRDAISQTEYKPEEDPRLYRSMRTSRGPLSENWIESRRGQDSAVGVMCAYKLCKVEFRYWGMQSKIEQFIHDVGLRRIMLRAHRQAWCWQDEWCDLTMEDIRELEEETARALAQRMGQRGEEPGGGAWGGPGGAEGPRPLTDSVDGPEIGGDGVPKQWSLSSRSSHCSQVAGAVTHQSLSEWRMQNIARDSDNSSDEEFFDAHEDLSDNDEVFSRVITRWSSNDFIDKAGSAGDSEERQGDTSPGLQDRGERPPSCSMDNRSLSETASSEYSSQSCKIHVLILVLHGGNILEPGPGDPSSQSADLSTLASVFETVTRVHFPEALGHVESRIVPCPPICSDALALISNLSPYGYDDDGLTLSQDHTPLAALPLLATSSAQYRDAVNAVIARSNQVFAEFLKSEEGTNFKGQVCLIGDCVGGILGFDALCNNCSVSSATSSQRGSVSTERLSPEILIDSDTLSNSKLERCRQLSRSHNELSTALSTDSERHTSRKHSNSSTSDIDSVKQHHNFLSTLQGNVLKEDGGLRRSSSSSFINLDASEKLNFDVSDFFLFGCPLGLVLALRTTIAPGLDRVKLRPACQQLYNLFHPADPSACRLEPLLARDFHMVPPYIIPRYQKFPLGDGNSSLLADTLQSYPSIFSGVPEPTSTTTLTAANPDIW
ncbi:membrane-associated phosphatidylinositol transfer protein 1-like, partial [Scyliorhinus torazame]